MARARRSGARGPARCACLPSVIPDDVQRALDDRGGVEGLVAGLPGGRELRSEASVHGAMSDPLRLRVMHLLRGSPLCVCVIRAAMLVEDSKLSYHLGILKAAGLLRSRKKGSWVVYGLTDAGRRWLEHGGD